MSLPRPIGASARESADPARYSQAAAAFGEALRRDPRSVDATIGMATLALARHDFRAGLRYAQRVGLAATLTALGLLVVHGGRLATRLRVPHSLVTGLPAASALVIVTLGCLLTLQAVPKLL